MAAREFVFALELPGQERSGDLLGELASLVLRQAGCAREAAPALIKALQTALASASANGVRCDVRFRLQSGELEIVVSSGPGRVWRIVRPMP